MALKLYIVVSWNSWKEGGDIGDKMPEDLEILGKYKITWTVDHGWEKR